MVAIIRKHLTQTPTTGSRSQRASGAVSEIYERLFVPRPHLSEDAGFLVTELWHKKTRWGLRTENSSDEMAIHNTSPEPYSLSLSSRVRIALWSDSTLKLSQLPHFLWDRHFLEYSSCAPILYWHLLFRGSGLTQRKNIDNWWILGKYTREFFYYYCNPSLSSK